ncbi:MAG: mechanosensitive ion channel, partial [Mucinivorans sp.]
LVFKDTILGFVASIQLSAQDMVRPGDWIEMPSKNADGTVLDINVNSVKVQNWDNTITMIPIYSMVSESFTNWRGMEQSSGRRFVRHLAVDIASITLANEELLKRLRQSPITAPYFEQTLSLAQQSSPAETLSNLALWRAHLELFLKRNANINQQMSIFVRYRPDISDKGLGVEIYAFSSEKNSELYDVVHRSVVEYVVTSSPLFNIVLFQSPSGENFRRKN